MEMLKYLFPFNADPILASVMAMLVLLCWGLLVYVILLIVDSIFMPELTGFGVIIKMEFKESHHTTHLMHVGKTLVPTTKWHPDAWTITIRQDGVEGTILVEESEYQQIQVGMPVKTIYSVGRVWKSLYLKKVSFLFNQNKL